VAVDGMTDAGLVASAQSSDQPPSCRNTQPTSVVPESAPPHLQGSSCANIMLDLTHCRDGGAVLFVLHDSWLILPA